MQKNALRIILKEEYETYAHALAITGLDCLVDRCEQLCLKFAKACLKNENVCDMFPATLQNIFLKSGTGKNFMYLLHGEKD